MHLLVTGASRGLGRSLAEGLSVAGHSVRALVRTEADQARLSSSGFTTALGDVTEPASLLAALDGCDGVVHAAAMVQHGGDEAEMWRVNVEGTANVWRAAARLGVGRAILISSVAVYATPDTKDIVEDGPFGEPWSTYGRTKRAADERARELGLELGLHTVCLRSSVVWGPYDTSFLPRVAEAISQGGFVFVGDPDRPMSLTAAEHVTDCALAALGNERANGFAFNVADGELPSWRQVAGMVADTLGLPHPTRRVPRWAARLFGSACDAGRATGLWRPPPALSRFSVEIAGLRCTHSTARAQEILGYAPRRSFLHDGPVLARQLLAR